MFFPLQSTTPVLVFNYTFHFKNQNFPSWNVIYSCNLQRGGLSPATGLIHSHGNLQYAIKKSIQFLIVTTQALSISMFAYFIKKFFWVCFILVWLLALAGLQPAGFTFEIAKQQSR